MNNLELIRDLSSGVNEHQPAKLYKAERMLDYEAGFELSYCDIKSLTHVLAIISEFFDVNAVASVNNTHVYGVALAPTLEDALLKVMDANPIDVQKSTVAVSKVAGLDFVRMLSKNNLAVAPDFTEEAIEYMNKRDIRFVKIKTPLSEYKQYLADRVFITPFGTIVEAPNVSELNKDTFKVETKTKPTVEQIEDAVFAWKLVKYVKSRGVVVSKGFKTTAIIQGVQDSALELALDYSCDTSKEAVVAVDGSITPHDLDVVAQGRVSAIILPFASPEVIKLADKYQLVLITTGFTNYLD